MPSHAAWPFREVFESCYRDLVAYVRRKVSCPALAADIVQDTYVRLASESSGAAVENPRAFAFRVAGNLAIDHLRRERARGQYEAVQTAVVAASTQALSAEQELLDRQRLDRVMTAIAELPPRCREVFVLRRFENLHQSEIAARLGISRNMVEKHMRRALLQCLDRLGEE